MGAGTDAEKGLPTETPLQPPPAYQEKEPLPDDPPVTPPVITQRQCDYQRCQRKYKKCRRSCCCCCTLLALILLSIVAIIFVGMLKGMWSEPYVDMEFNGSRSDVVYRTFGQGSDVSISCKVQLHHTKFVPLVQWFHDPNEDPDDGITGYRLFAVHDQILGDGYQRGHEVIFQRGHDNWIEYTMFIRNVQREDAGRYACQVPRTSHEFRLDEFQESGRSSSSSSDADDDEYGKRKHHHHHHHHDKDEGHGGCWYRGRRNDYVIVDVV